MESVGWIVVVKQIYQYGDRVYLNAGAGIVAESVPKNEYIESVNKMNTMLNNLVLKA